MKRIICLALAVIAFLAAAQCQECNTNTQDRNLSICLNSIDTKCGEVAQFCPGVNPTPLRMETFKIDVENKGEESLSNLILNLTIPKEMKYINYTYIERGGGELIERLNPQEFDGVQNTSIELYIGDLRVSEIRSILFRTYLNCSNDKTQIEVGAIGYNSTEIKLNLTKCNCTSDSTNCKKKLTSKDIEVEINVCEANSNTRAFFGKYSQPARLDIYNITIRNGDMPLDYVILYAGMDPGIMFKNTAYSDSRRGRLNVRVYPIVFDENSNTYLTWNLGNMLAGETRSIILEAYLKHEVDNRGISVEVLGTSQNLPEGEELYNLSIRATDVNNPDCSKWEIQ